MPSSHRAAFPAALITGTALAAGTAAAALAARTWTGLRRNAAAVPVHGTFWGEPRHADGELLYAALGDSAGQSIGTRDPLDGYVGGIARRLAAATGRSVAVANLSVSGAVTADVLREQLPRLAALPRTPDVVTCVIGGNDVVFRTSAGDFEAAYAALADALPAGTVIGDVPCFRLPPWEGRVQALNAVIHAQAARAGLPVAGLHAVTSGMRWTAHLGGLSADLFHPNERGYAAWAEALWSVIEDRVPG